MPMPSEMGIAIPAAVKTAIINDLTNALTALNGIKVVQLTTNERQGAQSIAEKRFPYVQKGIKGLAPAYPNLQPGFLPFSSAENDLDSTQDISQILLIVKEIIDRFTDFGLASEHFAYLYVRKFYAIAQEAQAVNTPGADTVVSELSPLFEGQGQSNAASPTPGPGTPP
jgi:hypothetical protein